MTSSRLAITIAAFLISLAVGSALFFVAYQADFGDRVSLFFSEVSGSLYLRIFLGALGVAIVFIGLFTLSLLTQPSMKEECYQFTSDLGDVRISLSAIEKFITRKAEEMSSVQKIRPRVSVSKDRKKLSIDLRVSLWPDSPLNKSGESIQNDIVRHVRDTLGIEDIARVSVSVEDIPTRKRRGLLPSQRRVESPPTPEGDDYDLS